MARETLLTFIGALIVLSPFSGLPLTWLQIGIPLLGLIVVVVGVTLRFDRSKRERPASIPNTTQLPVSELS